ncbi:hypothetical protein R2203_002088 [Cronobacter dublinensis]|nr:hypothetical protein [Cronobacter dublinensis]
MKRILLLLILVLFSTNSFAGLWPVFTNVKAENVTTFYTYTRLTFSQRLMEIGPASERIAASGDRAIIANGCFDVYRCGGANTLWRSNITGDSRTPQGQLAVAAYNAGGKDVTTVTVNASVEYLLQNKYCVGYAVMSENGFLDRGSMPVCMDIPPAHEWCKITTPELLLDHGTIALRNAENDVAQTTMKVNCTTPMDVEFKLVNDDKYVYLDEGKSLITIDDQLPGSKFNLPAGGSELTVKDMLTGVKTEGVHVGSSVLVMMPY